MNQLDELNRIKKFLSRYQQLVKINTSNNEYDINVHSENILIPILNAIFDANFTNANLLKKNAEAVDLIDIRTKIGVQVTATAKITKIKSSLEKFSKSEFSKNINKIYVFVLTEKQKSYSQQSLDKSRGRLTFYAKDNIIDATDVYAILKSKNNVELQRRIAVDFVKSNHCFSFQTGHPTCCSAFALPFHG